MAALLGEAIAVGNERTKGFDQPEPSLDNPRGFFESRQLMELNEALLESLGSNWNTPPLLPVNWPNEGRLELFNNQRSKFEDYALNSLWVDKDPRLCVTYPAFLHILLKRVPLICVIRDPLEVALSLYARNAIPMERGLGIWFVYNMHLASNIQKGDALTVYESLLDCNLDNFSDSVFNEIDIILDTLGNEVPSKNKWGRIIRKNVDTNLRRSTSPLTFKTPQALIDKDLLFCCTDTYQKILQEKCNKIDVFIDLFSALPKPILEVIARQNVCSAQSSFYAQLHSQQETISMLENQGLALKAELEGMRNSRLWKLSKVFRSFCRFIRLSLRF